MSARMEITGGGTPSDAELAAIVVALTPVRREDESGTPAIPGWQIAALHEGVGSRPFASAADLLEIGRVRGR